MVSLIRGAAQTWMDANPRLHLIYDGVTTDVPANGNNIIGWGTSRGIGTAAAHHTPNQYGPIYTGFDIVIQSHTSWSWEPCDPAAGQPCTAERDGEASDFQAMVTHEWGHVLGLDHPCVEQSDCDSPNDDEELTMKTGGTRIRRTLALGDILGVRELYPTDAPMPTIYRP